MDFPFLSVISVDGTVNSHLSRDGRIISFLGSLATLNERMELITHLSGFALYLMVSY